ncbi:MAG TPA: ABC transporter permease [Solirubrobacteraceae bacterium]|nr:ABC transporter permease [Solirubrobacteraceae bacterium]
MRGRRFWMVARAVAWRSIHNTFTNPAILLPSVIFPLFFLVAFAGGLSSVGKIPGFNYPPGYTAFQYVFVLLQSAAFGGVFTGFSIARDFESGFARRLLLGAPRRSGIVAGYVIGAAVRGAFTAVVVTVAALVAGMRVSGGGVDLLGLATLALLVNFCATLWGCGVAMRFRTIQAGSLIQMPVFILLFVAPVYVPQKLLSGWISVAAKVNPVTALLNAGRGFVAGRPVSVGLAFALLAALVAMFAVWAMRGLRSAERAGG